MNSNFFIALIAVFIGFLTPAVCYNFIVRRSNRFNNGVSLQKDVFLPFAATTFILSSAVYFIFYTPQQFLTSFSFIELLVPFATVILACLSVLSGKTEKFFLMLLFIGSAAGSAALPENAAAAVLPLDPIYNRIIICIVWFFFSYIYRYANSGDAMLPAQSATIAAGIGILGVIDAIPLMLGIIGLIFAASLTALTVFTWHPSRLVISSRAASCFGFILFALCIWTASENAGSCVIIYALYFLVDFIWAIGLRLSFVEKYAVTENNTAYREAVADGMLPATATSFSLRVQALLLFLGSFQALADKQSSLLLISTLITIWFLYKFRNISDGNAGFRDINRQVLDDLQDRVNDIKQYINKGTDF